MRLNQEQQDMLAGKSGRGCQKAMEIIVQLAEAQGSDQLVRITYAHLMPPDLMFFPYGKQGGWAHDMTHELTQGVEHLRVPATMEPKFCDMGVAKVLQFSDEVIGEMRKIQGAASEFYERIGVIPTYSAMPFYVRPGRFGEHVCISESISTLWYNSMFGSFCERDDGVTSLSAAITGYCPLAGAHLQENRHGEVIIRLSEELDFNRFEDSDWDAFSLAASRLGKEKRPILLGVPQSIGLTELKHLFSVIAVESGLTIMHIVGVTPEAPTLEKALNGRKPLAEFTIGKKELREAYEIANTTTDTDIDFVLMGCPHLTMKEIKEMAEVLDGKKIHDRVRVVAVTTKLLLEQARDMGYADIIRRSGVDFVCDMCIAFAGTQVKGVIATNSMKADFFYAGFSSDGTRKVRFGSTKDCARAALTGKWEGRVI